MSLLSSLRWPVSSVLAAAMVLALPVTVKAQEGDAARGQKLVNTCYGCHGVSNYKNVYPTYSVPKLQGQHPEYLVAALQAYKSGERAHSTMHAQASTLSEQDMRDVAAFLSSESIKAGTPKPKSEKAPPAKVGELCNTCHGKDGVGITPLYPNISGQHRDYIERALHDYKNGTRKNALMAPMAAQLSDKDIKELAEYYSGMRPGLITVEHSNWFTQEKKKK